MKHLKSQRGSLPIVEALLGVLVIGVGVLIYLQLHKPKAATQPVTTATTTESKPTETAKPVDPTAKWTAYSNVSGKFSLKYNPDWKKIVCDGSAQYLYLAPTSTTLAKCSSDFGGMVQVRSDKDDIRPKPGVFETDYTSASSTTANVDGVVGIRYFGEEKDGVFTEKGTKVVEYFFYTNGRTYTCLYRKRSTDPDVLADFDLMVKNTLKFSS